MIICIKCNHDMCEKCDITEKTGKDVEFAIVTIKWVCCQCKQENIFKDKVLS